MMFKKELNRRNEETGNIHVIIEGKSYLFAFSADGYSWPYGYESNGTYKSLNKNKKLNKLYTQKIHNSLMKWLNKS